MEKDVLISIHPKWCDLIAKGLKTLEVRKTRPNFPLPFKAYIYSTMPVGKVIGEFICDEIYEYSAEFVDDDLCYEEIRWIKGYNEDGEEESFIIATNEDDDSDDCSLCRSSCLTFKELKDYVGVNFHDKPFYAWHIKELVIYDKPKKLTDFYKKCNGHCFSGCPYYRGKDEDCDRPVFMRPPQSWCYAERVN